jgi:hypothetical protein
MEWVCCKKYLKGTGLKFPIWNAVRTELSWTRYRMIDCIENGHSFYFSRPKLLFP